MRDTINFRGYRIANTQEHWSMEGRAIVREGTESITKHPDFATKMGVESHAPANYGKDDYKTLQDKSTGQYRVILLMNIQVLRILS